MSELPNYRPGGAARTVHNPFPVEPAPGAAAAPASTGSTRVRPVSAFPALGAHASAALGANGTGPFANPPPLFVPGAQRTSRLSGKRRVDPLHSVSRATTAHEYAEANPWGSTAASASTFTAVSSTTTSASITIDASDSPAASTGAAPVVLGSVLQSSLLEHAAAAALNGASAAAAAASTPALTTPPVVPHLSEADLDEHDAAVLAARQSQKRQRRRPALSLFECQKALPLSASFEVSDQGTLRVPGFEISSKGIRGPPIPMARAGGAAETSMAMMPPPPARRSAFGSGTAAAAAAAAGGVLSTPPRRPISAMPTGSHGRSGLAAAAAALVSAHGMSGAHAHGAHTHVSSTPSPSRAPFASSSATASPSTAAAPATNSNALSGAYPSDAASAAAAAAASFLSSQEAGGAMMDIDSGAPPALSFPSSRSAVLSRSGFASNDMLLASDATPSGAATAFLPPATHGESPSGGASGGDAGAGSTVSGANSLFVSLPSELMQLDELGRGAGGTVFKALHVPSLQLVALKLISVYDKGRRHQLVKELTALSKNAHVPQLVSMYAAFYDQGCVSLVFEYMNRRSLQEVLETYGALPEPLLRHVILQVALGLRAMHSSRLLHRDVKPANILINHVGNVKLADFGVLGQLEDTMANVHTQVGTQAFLSPERINGSYSTPADMWSLGVTIITLALGDSPYAEHLSGGYFGLAQRIVNHEAPTLPPCSRAGVPFSPALAAIVRGLLQKDPAQRLTADQLARDPWLNDPSFTWSAHGTPIARPTPTDLVDMRRIVDIMVADAKPCSSGPTPCISLFMLSCFTRIGHQLGIPPEEVQAEFKRRYHEVQQSSALTTADAAFSQLSASSTPSR